VALICASVDCKHAEQRRYKASGMWHCVIGQVVPVVLKDHSAFIFGVKQSSLFTSTASP
jgi:hypothetical protein